MKPDRSISRTQTALGIAVFLVLCAVAAAVYWKQAHYDPSIFRVELSATHPSQPSKPQSAADLSAFAPSPLKALGPAEEFDRDTLSDKIDGKAELYLESGFVKLTCQRFAPGNAPDKWLELFVYDMGAPLNAFSVYSNQRRADGIRSDAAKFAYSAGNSFFLAHGKSYLEIVSSTDDPEIMRSCEAIGREFVKQQPAGAEVSPLELLPPEGLQPETVKLYLSNAYGCEKFDNVISADYLENGTTVTAFVSLRKSPEEAKAIADEYFNTLMGLGASTVETSMTEAPNLRMADALTGIEMLFHHGKIVAGMHSSPRQPAEAVLKRLAKFVEEKQK